MLISLKKIQYFISFILSLGLYLSSVTILAENAQKTITKKVVIKSRIKSNKKHKSKNNSVSSRLGVSLFNEYESYIAQDSDLNDRPDPQLLGVRVKYPKSRKSKSSLKLNLGMELQPNVSSKPYVHISDAYGIIKFSKYIKLSLGFKNLIWNELDHHWGLGLWQPQVRRDYLNPQQVGLPGAYLDVGNKTHKLTAFVSALYIPDQGPHFEDENGSINSKNHWFSGPQDTINFEGVDTPVKYTINLPEVKDVINQTSYAFKYKAKLSKINWIQLSMANKPMNQLRLLTEHQLIVLNSESYLDVNVYPEVIRHRTAAMDVGMKTKNTKAWLSYNFDTPIYNKLEEELNTGNEGSSLVEAQFLGAYLSHRLENTPYKIKGGFLMSQQEELNDSSDSFLENVESAFKRFDYDEFVTVGFEKKSYVGKFGIDMNYFYSIVNEGGFLNSKFKYYFSKALNINFGLKIIGSQKENNSFYDKYRSNDSVTFGVKYAF